MLAMILMLIKMLRILLHRFVFCNGYCGNLFAPMLSTWLNRPLRAAQRRSASDTRQFQLDGNSERIPAEACDHLQLCLRDDFLKTGQPGGAAALVGAQFLRPVPRQKALAFDFR